MLVVCVGVATAICPLFSPDVRDAAADWELDSCSFNFVAPASRAKPGSAGAVVHLVNCDC